MINNKIYYSLIKYKGESDITLLDHHLYTLSKMEYQYIHKFNKLCKKYLGKKYGIRDWKWSIIGTISILTYYNTIVKCKLESIQTHDFFFLRIYEINQDSFLIIPKTLLGLYLYKEFIN